MKAKLTDRKQKYTTSHRKEKAGLHKCYAMLAPSQFRKDQMQAVAELRIYWPGNIAYACLWTYSDKLEKYPQGSGQAGGGGYCKMSAAAGEAIHNAGFDLSESIHGVGESAIRDALKAVAKALGYPNSKLFETHP